MQARGFRPVSAENYLWTAKVRLKDKDRLAFGSFGYLRPKHLPIRQIGLNAENIRQPILQVDPPDKRRFLSPVEIDDDVYI